jgi:hypothetical protein
MKIQQLEFFLLDDDLNNKENSIFCFIKIKDSIFKKNIRK